MTVMEDTYTAFMLDYAAGNQSPAFALAGDLHVLLSDTGSASNDVWQNVREAIDFSAQLPRPSERLDAACKIISTGYQSLGWRRGWSGADYAKTDLRGGKFMRLSPGKSVPAHGHKKLEVTVVLSGELSDGAGNVFEAGELLFGVPGHRHKPAAHGAQDCVCFVALG